MQTAEFKPVKIDLHFHTDGSEDGRTTEEHVGRFLQDGTLDIIAITDHDTIATALRLKERHPLAIIAGVEVTTAQGELVGLGVKEPIEKGMSAIETAQAIHAQGAKVMFQHPFHKNGLSSEVARRVHSTVGIDLVEVNNGRDALKWWYGIWAQLFAQQLDIPMVSNGDTHGPPGVGRSHTQVSRMPDVNDMNDVIDTLKYQQVDRVTRFAGIRALRQPSLARSEKQKARAAA
jgi:predicted metal-dependent phosphoesterase TrpH